MVLAYLPQVDEFMTYLRAVTPSTKTVMTYGQALPQFNNFLALTGTPIAIAPRNVTQDFVVWLVGRPLSPRSVRTIYFGVRRYLEWLRNRETIPNFAEPDLPRAPMLQLLTFRTDAEIVEYLEALDVIKGVQEPTLSLMRLWPFCGLRLDEMVRLRREDLGETIVQTGDGPVPWTVLKVVYGKGGKFREVGVLPPGARVLSHYTKKWLQNRALSSPYLWPSRRSKGTVPVHRDSIMIAFQKVARVMRKHVTSHCLRRTYGTLLYRMGVPIETVSVMLGHKNIQTTLNFYVQIGLGDHLEKLSLGLKKTGGGK